MSAGPGMSETTAESSTSGPFSTLAEKVNFPRFSSAVPFAATRRVCDGVRLVPAGTSRGGTTVLAAPESGKAKISNLVGSAGREHVRAILLNDPVLLLTVLMALTRVRETLLEVASLEVP